MAESKKQDESKRTWWFYINLTPILLVALLIVAGFFIKREYDKWEQRQLEERGRAEQEREAKEKEKALALAERGKKSKEEAEAVQRKKDDEVREQLARKKAEEDKKLARLKEEEEEKKRREAEDQKRKQEEVKAKQAEEASRKKKVLVEVAARMCRQYDDSLSETIKLSEDIKREEIRIVGYRGQRAQILAYNQAVADRDKALAKKKVAQKALDDLAPSIRSLGLEQKSAQTKFLDRAAAMGVELTQVPSTEAAALTLAMARGKAGNDTLAQIQAAISDLLAQPAAAMPEPKKATAAALKVFHLKDGKKIIATIVVETDDQYGVKTADGKSQTIPKDSVEKITEQ